MKKLVITTVFSLLFAISFSSCREKKSAGEKIEDGVEEVGEGIEDAADDVEDSVD